ncbi:MAG: hypothetical protein JO153_03100 [Solirubrobacterales bacterium]|nr:hypothetical protein [Solirubrobacterales bacterium]MBV9915465.1 hypothetical protein [Solirubrobacterales bacterium]
MGGGLVLFGVGTGTGGGGLLNAFGGGSSNQKQVISSDERAALNQVKAAPNNPAGWAALVQARWTSAGQGSNFDQSTSTFTTAGKNKLSQTTQAWQKYLTLTQKPDPDVAILAARAYAALGDYSNQASAWELVANANPTETKAFECLAVSAYAAKQTRKGDLAAAKAVSLTPKASRLTLTQTLQQAKTNPSIAQQC